MTQDVYPITTGASDRTITLPGAATATQRIITIIKADSGAGHVIVDGEGAETINGSATWELWHQYEQLQIISDGSNWLKINSNELRFFRNADRAATYHFNGSAASQSEVIINCSAITPPGASGILFTLMTQCGAAGQYAHWAVSFGEEALTGTVYGKYLSHWNEEVDNTGYQSSTMLAGLSADRKVHLEVAESLAGNANYWIVVAGYQQ